MEKLNDQGQMQVLEVVLVSGMLLLALFFIRNLEVSVQTNIEKENKLERTCDSVLESLSVADSPNNHFSSLLAYYIHQFKNGDYINDFISFIKESLPEGVVFKIDLVDLSALYRGETHSPEEVYKSIYWIEEEGRSSRLVAVDGNLYNIILMVWYNQGG